MRIASVPYAVQVESYQPWPDVLYACPVVGTNAEGQQSDWAQYVRRAVDACGGSVTELKRRSGVGRTSLYRYLKNDGTRVTMDVARRIALAINDKAENAIRAAGSLLDHDDTDGDPRLRGLDPNDPVVAHIMSINVDEEMRGFMLDRRREQIAQRNEQDLKELEFWANKGRGAA